MDRVAAARGGDAGRDRAEQDGKEGAAFDQRIAGRQFFASEQVGQNSVFDRPEQRAEHAEQKQRDKEQDQRVERKARHRHRGDEHFDKFDTLRDPGLIEAVGKFAAETGQEEVRPDEGGAGELNERRRIGIGQVIDDQEPERGS